MKPYKKEYDSTTNNRVYKLAKKHVYEMQGKIACAFCPYHKHENERGSRTYGKPQSWKNSRVNQYKTIL